MIETRHLKNVVIFTQTILSFVLSRKIINIYNNIAQKYGNVSVKHENNNKKEQNNCNVQLVWAHLCVTVFLATMLIQALLSTLIFTFSFCISPWLYTTNVELPNNSNANKVLSAHTTPTVNTDDDKMLFKVNKHYVTLLCHCIQPLVLR